MISLEKFNLPVGQPVSFYGLDYGFVTRSPYTAGDGLTCVDVDWFHDNGCPSELADCVQPLMPKQIV